MGTAQDNSEERIEWGHLHGLWGAAHLIYQTHDNTACFRQGMLYLDSFVHHVATLCRRVVSYFDLASSCPYKLECGMDAIPSTSSHISYREDFLCRDGFVDESPAA